MIIDRLEMCGRYSGVHPGFAEAFSFLGKTDLDALPDGRHELAGDGLYAVIVRAKGRGRKGVRLETHRRYIDIQYSLAGRDFIGWADARGKGFAGEGYQEEKDMEFHPLRPCLWLPLPPGVFAVFFPEDAHAPMAAAGSLHKVVVKVPV